MNAINDIYYCNTDIKADNKFIMVTNKHLCALDFENISYMKIRYLMSNTGIVYYNVAVNHKEFDKTLVVIQNVNALAASKIKHTFRRGF